MTQPEERVIHPRYDELIHAYLDGEATPEQEAEFRQLLADAAFRRRVAEYAIDAGHLYELGREGLLDSRTNVSDVVECPIPGGRQKTAKAARPSRRMFTALCVAVAVVLVATAFLVFRGNGPSGHGVAIARIIRSEGTLSIEVNGQQRPVNGDGPLHEGETLRTGGLLSFASLTLDDGTELHLAGDAAISLSEQDGQRRVTVIEGHLTAQVQPQPSQKPLLILTPLAEIEVLGTSLAISADSHETELGVHDGRVRMQRRSDGQSVEVAGGQYAVASSRDALVVRPLSSAREAWSEDFDNGLPAAWRFGQWIADGLPEGSRGAVRASRWSIREGREIDHYHITTPKHVTRGLFRISPDAELHFTYKMDRPGWFQIMMGVRPDDLSATHLGNYEAQNGEWGRLPAGAWRTASVPLSAFRKVRPKRDYRHSPLDPPRPGDMAYMLWFSTGNENRGLTIDRIWISEPREATGRGDEKVKASRFDECDAALAGSG